MKNAKRAKLVWQMGIIITLVLLVGFFILWKRVDMKSTAIVQNQITNQMLDAVESRAAIINDYVDTAEEFMVAFAQSDEVRNVLLHPQSEEYLERAQQYTVDFANVKGIFEGLYIASTDTYVYTHTSEGAIGIYTRKGDSLKQLQDTILTKHGITNCGIMVSPSTGNMVIAMYYPLFENDKCIGYVGAAVYAERLMDSLLQLDIKGMAECEYVFIDKAASTYLYNKDEALLNTEVTEDGYLKVFDTIDEDKEESGIVNSRNAAGGEEIIVYKYIPERDWVFAVKDTKAHVFTNLKELRLETGGFCLIIAVVILIIIIMVISAIGGQITAVSRAIERLGEMDLHEDYGLKKYKDKNNEIGVISSAVIHTSGQLKSYIDEVNSQLYAMSHGDFTRKSNGKVEFKGEFQKLQQSMLEIQKSLRESFSEIGTVTEQLAVGAQTVSNSSSCLADAATHENVLVMEIDDHVKDISEQVSATAENAIRAREQSREAAELVNESKEKMKALTDAMSKIAESAEAISSLSGNLEQIAKQTNILSLNALVEANRVGEAGRSFGVVANQIRDLAEEADRAATDSYQLIEQTMEAITFGSNMTNETAEYLYRVAEQTVMIDESVTEIADAAQQQNIGLTGIKNRLEEISKAVETTAAMAQQEAAASNELDSQANVLEQNIRRYRV